MCASDVLDCVLRGDVAEHQADAICSAVQAALAQPAAHAKLVGALDGLHYADKSQLGLASLLGMSTTPELTVSSMLRNSRAGGTATATNMHLTSEPSMTAKGAGGSDGGVGAGATASGVLWHVATFLEVLGRVAPAQLLDALKEPLLTFDALPPEVRCLCVFNAALIVLLCKHVS